METVLACPDGESDGGKGRKLAKRVTAMRLARRCKCRLPCCKEMAVAHVPTDAKQFHHDQKGRPSQRGSQILHILDRVCEGLAGRANTGRAKA